MVEGAVASRLKHQRRFFANARPEFEVVIASGAKQSKGTAALQGWIASLRSQ
jgi:hypothetical protein